MIWKTGSSFGSLIIAPQLRCPTAVLQAYVHPHTYAHHAVFCDDFGATFYVPIPLASSLSLALSAGRCSLGGTFTGNVSVSVTNPSVGCGPAPFTGINAGVGTAMTLPAGWTVAAAGSGTAAWKQSLASGGSALTAFSITIAPRTAASSAVLGFKLSATNSVFNLAAAAPQGRVTVQYACS